MPTIFKALFISFGSIFVLATAFLLFTGDDDQTRESMEPSAARPSTADTQRASESTELPTDLDYEIVSESSFGTDRRSLDVRLSRRVDQQTLRSLARELRAGSGTDFDRTFIVYYLPGMEVDAGGWATSHFDPDLEVEILGRAEDQDPLDELRGLYGTHLTGAWENTGPLAATYVLVEEGEGLKLVRVWPDGSRGEIPVVEVQSSQGRRLEDPENDFGEYYLIRDGRLELRDSEGVVWSARPR